MQESVFRLLEEVAEIEALIAQWQHDSDPEVQWAIELLQCSLDRRRARLRRRLH